MRRVVLVFLALLAAVTGADAQTVVGARIQLSSGPCTLRSGSGAPSSGLGAVCDTYFRNDSPYTIYVKTGASTWTATVIMPASAAAGDLVTAASSATLGRIAAVASGQVLTSNGTGTDPVYSATPTVTSVTATASVAGFSAFSDNAQIRFTETDAAADNQIWLFRAQNNAFDLRILNDATTVGSNVLSFARSGAAGGNVTVSPSAGDIILAPGGLDVLPDTGYTKNLGSLTTKYLTLHAAELWVETLVAQNTIATIGGRVLVGPTTVLVADFAAAATTINVKHNQIVSGDRLYMEADGKVEFIAVTSGASGSAGNYTYSVTRNLDGSGANDWYAGDAVFNTGTTGDGYIDLYSVSGVNAGSTVGPTIVGNVRTGTTYSNLAPRWAIGNLNGIAGYGADTYGAFFGDASATNVTIDATNGFRIRSATTDKFKADTSGNLSIVGDLSVGTAGVIRSGSTSYASGTGYVLDYNSGTPRLRVGTTSGNRLAWDGTDLTLVSANATIGPSGVAITPSTTTATARSYGFTVATGSLGVFGTDAGGADLGRSAFLQSEWTGVGDYPNDVLAYIRARHFKSGGTDRDTFIRLRSTDTAGSIYMQAINGVVQLVTPTFQTDADFSVISNTEFRFGTGIQFTADTTVPSGGIAQTTGDGLTLKAVAGSTRDFTVQSTGGTAVIGISGTEIGFAGVSGDGTGKVLCVKSDATIGTCNPASIGASTCTCG